MRWLVDRCTIETLNRFQEPVLPSDQAERAGDDDTKGLAVTKPARDRERDRALKNRSKSREPGVDHAHDSTRFQIGDDLRRRTKASERRWQPTLSFVRVTTPRHERVVITSLSAHPWVTPLNWFGESVYETATTRLGINSSRSRSRELERLRSLDERPCDRSVANFLLFAIFLSNLGRTWEDRERRGDQFHSRDHDYQPVLRKMYTLAHWGVGGNLPTNISQFKIVRTVVCFTGQ